MVEPNLAYSPLPAAIPLLKSCESSGSDKAGSATGTTAEDSSLEDTSTDENIPLSALFNTAPIHESDILPPSILQSMNFWMNDSMLTGATTAAAGVGLGLGGGSGGGSIPAQVTAAQFTSIGQPQPQPQPQSLTQTLTLSQQQVQNLDILSNLIPMDIALGLPLFTPTQFNPSAAAASTAAARASGSLGDFNSMGSMAGFQANAINQSIEFSTDFMQQFNQQYSQQFAPLSMTPTTATATTTARINNTGIPISVVSQTPLFGSMDISRAGMMPFSTSGFTSPNMVSQAGFQRSMQGISGLQEVMKQQQQQPMRGNFGSSDISALLRTPLLSPNASSTGGNSNSNMRSLTADSATSLFRTVQAAMPGPGSGMDGGIPRYNSMPLKLPVPVSVPMSVPMGMGSVTPRNQQQQPQKHQQKQQCQSVPPPRIPASTPLQRETSGGGTGFTNQQYVTPSTVAKVFEGLKILPAHQSQQQQQQPMQPKQPEQVQIQMQIQDTSPVDIDKPVTLSMLQTSTSTSSTSSGPTEGGAKSAVGAVPQMNNAKIPQILRDVVAEHPQLGCPELIYNLLITHVVLDCSRIGIYGSRLFWMRVRQYKVPKFYLLASIADACRSWTQPDAQRTAMPANLDETCYALAMHYAKSEATAATVLSALGLITLGAYEFKSARFAVMVEHNCLACKIMTQITFRGSAYPWRAAPRRADERGLDANYQLLIRAFWRVYTALFFGTEIFLLDAPDDRDFLPEMPVHDDDFAHGEFEPDEAEEFGFRMVVAARRPAENSGCGGGELAAIICDMFVRQYKIANLFNRVQRGETTPMAYVQYLREWDRQMLAWRAALPGHMQDDLGALARVTQPLGAGRRLDLAGLSEEAMWEKRHQWNCDVGVAIEVLYVHMAFSMTRIKAHRIALMILMRENLDMVRNFQNSRIFAVQELPQVPGAPPVLGSQAEDAACFRRSQQAACDASAHIYKLLKFSHQFGFDLHAHTTVIIGTLLQVGLVCIGQVQSTDARVAWNAMLRLARVLGMIRSLDRWGPALYIFTNILKALGRPDLVLQVPSPETRALLAADTRRSMSADAPASCTDAGGKRKSDAEDAHGDEKRFELGDHHHGPPLPASPAVDDDDVTNPFPADHVISHIMREQKVSTATFFSPTLPILAASLLHSNCAGNRF
ncbi:hypothetical protein LPJ66_000040 [Kickxella alabastrina]|uniref:Uncharacterized protein n=1 Tax=Kickxella alabastrina TaxID=61397 RepID=A0ACC1IXF5_9FUNG|nr:hypothetical protein LPJ66_000040 [Kickxella alabastrina]